MHHVILVWPFPCVFVGIACSRLADRIPRSAIAVFALVVFVNVLNTNEYLADLSLNGAVAGWTDAFYRLTGAVNRYKSGQIGIVDWGYLNGLRMMYEGELKLTVLNDIIDKPASVAAMIASPDFILIQHTDDKQMFPDVNGRLRTAAASLGYSEQIQRVVHDDEGRPVFEIFRFEKTAP